MIDSTSHLSVAIIPIGKRHLNYAQRIAHELHLQGLRTDMVTDGTMKYRIRYAELLKPHGIIVVGDLEVQTRSVSLRARGGQIRASHPLTNLLPALQALQGH